FVDQLWRRLDLAVAAGGMALCIDEVERFEIGLIGLAELIAFLRFFPNRLWKNGREQARSQVHLEWYGHHEMLLLLAINLSNCHGGQHLARIYLNRFVLRQADIQILLLLLSVIFRGNNGILSA